MPKVPNFSLHEFLKYFELHNHHPLPLNLSSFWALLVWMLSGSTTAYFQMVHEKKSCKMHRHKFTLAQFLKAHSLKWTESTIFLTLHWHLKPKNHFSLLGSNICACQNNMEVTFSAHIDMQNV